jgi:hypothetical protein
MPDIIALRAERLPLRDRARPDTEQSFMRKIQKFYGSE